MSEICLKTLYNNMQHEMLGKLQTGASAYVNSGVKGDNTELNWINWFQEYLPKRYKVNKGIIIDSNGRQSEQIDLIIYDSQYSYLVFHQNDTLLIPAEGVYAVFEIKQDLTKDYIKYACKKAKSVRTLTRTSAPIPHAGGTYSPKPLHEIAAGILTTRSGWKSPIVSNVVSCIHDFTRENRLDFICCISDIGLAVDYNIFVDDYVENISPEIRYCNQDDSLIFFLLSLLKRLQDMGTVPAIDFSQYARHLDSKVYTNDNPERKQ